MLNRFFCENFFVRSHEKRVGFSRQAGETTSGGHTGSVLSRHASRHEIYLRHLAMLRVPCWRLAEAFRNAALFDNTGFLKRQYDLLTDRLGLAVSALGLNIDGTNPRSSSMLAGATSLVSWWTKMYGEYSVRGSQVHAANARHSCSTIFSNGNTPTGTS